MSMLKEFVPEKWQSFVSAALYVFFVVFFPVCWVVCLRTLGTLFGTIAALLAVGSLFALVLEFSNGNYRRKKRE